MDTSLAIDISGLTLMATGILLSIGAAGMMVYFWCRPRPVRDNIPAYELSQLDIQSRAIPLAPPSQQEQLRLQYAGNVRAAIATLENLAAANSMDLAEELAAIRAARQAQGQGNTGGG